jgi:hypothetical protein
MEQSIGILFELLLLFIFVVFAAVAVVAAAFLSSAHTL